MEEVIKKILKFKDDRNWSQFHSPSNLAKSIVIESGELLECFQWSDDHYDRDHVCEELADILNYCILLADKMDANIEEIILKKLAINEQKYPIDKSKGKSTKYNKL